MPAYCTIEDLPRFGVSRDALDPIQITDQKAGISAAQEMIDSYLRSRYTLPLVAVGGDIKRACAIITAYDLLSARGYNPNAPGDENLRERYLDIIRWLERIAAGTVTPDVTDSGSGSGTGGSSFGARVVSNVSRGYSVPDGTGGPFSGGR